MHYHQSVRQYSAQPSSQTVFISFELAVTPFTKVPVESIHITCIAIYSVLWIAKPLSLNTNFPGNVVSLKFVALLGDTASITSYLMETTLCCKFLLLET